MFDFEETVLGNAETFSGVLAPLFRRFLVDVDDVRVGFDQLNSEIKTRAENPNPDPGR